MVKYGGIKLTRHKLEEVQSEKREKTLCLKHLRRSLNIYEEFKFDKNE